jgi:hypothetical protein
VVKQLTELWSRSRVRASDSSGAPGVAVYSEAAPQNAARPAGLLAYRCS